MKYLSVCSGIEAATQAWHPLGWTPVAFSEIEPFPCAVLAHHYPTVPNWGDMTKFQEWPDADVDVLCGGTPCQSFSVAGLRQGLADPRGNLMLTYLAIAARYRPRWLVWENVPGVLSSSGGRDFGSFLGAMGQLGYGFAYRVLDAQYVRTCGKPFAVPQRRRRVFVVGYLGDWRRAAAVLIDREGLRGDSAPRRKAGQIAAPTISSRPTGGGGLGTDFDCDGGLIAAEVAPTLNAHFGDKMGLENQHINGGGACLLPPVSLCLNAGGMGRIDAESETLIPTIGGVFDVAQPIAIQERAISDNTAAGPDGMGVRQDGASYTIEARQVPQAVAFDLNQITSKTNRSQPDPAVHHTLPATSCPPHLAEPFTIMERGRDGGQSLESRQDGTSNAILTPNGGRGGMGVGAIATAWTVRRLTPVECERLQAFPDQFTRIPYRGKPADKCPDGPRYKALGNSMAVNVMQLIGERIAIVENTP